VAEIQRALRVLRQRGGANLDDLLDGPHRPGRPACFAGRAIRASVATTVRSPLVDRR